MPDVRILLGVQYVLTAARRGINLTRTTMKKITNSIFTRIFLTVLPVCILAIITCAAAAYKALERSVENSALKILSDSVSMLSANVEAGVSLEKLSAILEKYSGASGIRSTVIARDGAIVLDSDADNSAMTNHLDRVEVREAFAGKTYACVRYSQTLRAKFIYVSAPAGRNADSSVRYCVRQSMNLKLLDARKGVFARQIALFAFAAVLVCAGVSFVSARRMSAPLRQLASSASMYAAGNFEASLPHSNVAEIRQLSQSLFSMVRDLKKRINSLYKRNCELDEVLSQMRDCVFICSDDGEVRRYNSRCSDIFKIPDGVKNPRVNGLFRNPKVIAAVEKAFASRETVSAEFDHYDKSYSLTGIPLPYESKHARALFVIRDVSEERRAEMLRREFVAGASHELKTPITSIKMAAETIADDVSSAPRFLPVIAKESDRMTSLVDDMLLLSKVEFSDGGNFGKFDLSDSVKMAISNNESQIISNNDIVKNNCPDGLEIFGDSRLAEIAVGNLVSNAVRYGGEGCRITVDGGVSGDFVSVSVSDTGMGISPEDLPRVFERFFRADKGRSRALGGTGLGLALVKHIAILHGGSVSAESKLGVGSRFTITFKKS